MQKKKLLENLFPMVALMLYIIETTVDGTGRIVDFGYISLRMLLFGMALLATIYPVIKSFKQIIANPCVMAALLFGVAVAVWAVIGYRKGNLPTYIRADVTSVMAFALLPGFIAVLKEEKFLDVAVKTFFAAAVIIGVVMTVLCILNPFISKEWFETGLLSLIGRVSAVSRSGRKVTMFMVPGIVLAIMYLKNAKGLKKAVLYFFTACMLLTLIIGQTRSQWLGLAVALLVILVMRPHEIKRYLVDGTAVLLACLLLIGLASLTYSEFVVIPQLFSRLQNTREASKYELSDFEEIKVEKDPKEVENNAKNKTESVWFAEVESEGSGRWDGNGVASGIVSDALRKEIVARLKENIRSTFPVGTGLGYDLGLHRGGKAEYTYLDFLMKMGIGFFTFLAAFFTPVIMCIKNGIRHLTPETLSLLAGYLGMAATSALNPYITNPMGIMILCLLAASISIEINNDKQKQTTTESD